MITYGMVYTGFKDGIIRVIDSPDSDDPVCKIGDYWFYFTGSEGEGKTASQYVMETGIDDVCHEIYDTLWSFGKCDVFEDEYNYYEAYIRERLEVQI